MILDQFYFIEDKSNQNEKWEFNSELNSLGVFEKFLIEVYFDKFIPYAIGGIICGIFTAFLVYVLFKPLIKSYQNRKRKFKK